jgi:CMP-N,N'-diacetyllegionaminic acid synthase
MKVLALIPARGGSKGLPRKNVLPFAGKPLLVWSIEAAPPGPHGHLGCWRTAVSTDDPEIAAVARMHGAEVIARPAHLATDEALTDPVIVHALQRYTEQGWRPDVVVLLQPTVPVRDPGLVDRCVCRLMQTGADSIVTGYQLHFVWWRETSSYVDGDGHRTLPTWRSQCPRRPRRQDMEERETMFAEDGSIFVATSDLLERTGQRVGGKMEMFETTRSIDIDTDEDFAAAEAIMIRRMQNAGR